VVSVAALAGLVADTVVVQDSEAVEASVVFLALPLATSAVDRTITLAIARHKQ